MSKIALSGNASGTGTFTIASPNSNTDRTLTLPDQAGTLAVQGGAGVGKVLQVVSTTKTDTFSTTATSFVDVTGLSATITPVSASSRIFIVFTTNVGFDQYRGLALRLMRDSTPVCIGDSAGSRTQATNFTGQDIDLGGGFTGRVQLALTNNFIDSPNTTSATTYKIQIGAISETDGTTIFVNRSSQDADLNQMSRTASTITLMEIAA
jgi:hypothetical protein